MKMQIRPRLIFETPETCKYYLQFWRFVKYNTEEEELIPEDICSNPLLVVPREGGFLFQDCPYTRENYKDCPYHDKPD